MEVIVKNNQISKTHISKMAYNNTIQYNTNHKPFELWGLLTSSYIWSFGAPVHLIDSKVEPALLKPAIVSRQNLRPCFFIFSWQLFAKESLLIMPLRSYWSVSFCYLAIVYDRSWKCFWQTKVSLVGAVCVGDFLPIGLNLGSYFSWRFIISFFFNLA